MASWRNWLLQPEPSWSARCLRTLLRACSGFHWVAVTARNRAYDYGWFRARRLDIPVICVGNLTVGGTGKTPTVAWLARWFRQRHCRVAILSRGYGQLANDGRNDEALELELSLPDVPHLQNPDRYAAGVLAQDELDMQLVLLDDGFQHRRLARDLDIVVVDATDPPAAHWLLPGGLMREPWSGLRRAGVVLLSRTHLVEPNQLAMLEQRVARWAPGVPCLRTWYEVRGLHGNHSPLRSLCQLQGQQVLVVCAIGNPTAFAATLRQHGLQIADQRFFPDHHAFSADDVASLSLWAETHPECAAIVCTMKDWVKLQTPRIGGLPLVALQIELAITETDRAELEKCLHRLLERCTQDENASAIATCGEPAT